MNLGQLLREEGLTTLAAIDAQRGGASRYQYLKVRLGEVNADRIMRNLEVASWTQRGAEAIEKNLAKELGG
jgi:hypothetical protein